MRKTGFATAFLAAMFCWSSTHADILTPLWGTITGYDFYVINNCKKNIVLGLHDHSNGTMWYSIKAGTQDHLPDKNGSRITTRRVAALLYVERSDSIRAVTDPYTFSPDPEGYTAWISSGRIVDEKIISTEYGRAIRFVEYKDDGMTYDIEIDCYDRESDRMCRRAIELKANLCGYDCRQESSAPVVSTYELEFHDKKTRTKTQTQTVCPDCGSCMTSCISEFMPYKNCSKALNDMKIEHIARELRLPPTSVEKVIGPGHADYIDQKKAIREF